jgi:hypothetical protein
MAKDRVQWRPLDKFPFSSDCGIRSATTSLVCMKSLKLITVMCLALVRECMQKFPDWPPGARTASGTALCH